MRKFPDDTLSTALYFWQHSKHSQMTDPKQSTRNTVVVFYPSVWLHLGASLHCLASLFKFYELQTSFVRAEQKMRLDGALLFFVNCLWLLGLNDTAVSAWNWETFVLYSSWDGKCGWRSKDPSNEESVPYRRDPMKDEYWSGGQQEWIQTSTSFSDDRGDTIGTNIEISSNK